jgi:hypothetical protein
VPERRRPKGLIANALAWAFLVGLATAPFAFQGTVTPPWVQSAQRTAPVPLGPAPEGLPRLNLSAVATPVDPDLPPASLPNLDSAHMAALVAGEDLRLRTLLHHTNRMIMPEVIPSRGGLPTLVLPGPSSYTLDDLNKAGATVPQAEAGTYLLADSVLVAPGATLKLGGVGLKTLLMDSSASGFASLVTWGGTLVLAGDSAAAPLAITGWDRTIHQPAIDSGYGRPYIRAVGGDLQLKYVTATSLGFWSGRTGGVAWTGISSRASTGSAVSSRFLGNTYGAFVSRASQVQFSDDLFESNELDGLRLHRNALNSSVTGSSAVRNGGNGFVVSRGSTGDVLKGDLALGNRGNGILINGRPLVTGASPSGGSMTSSIGTQVLDSETTGNGRTGILVEGGSGTVIARNIVCGPMTGIAIRGGASDTTVAGNEVRCGGRIAVSVGPEVTGTTISGNLLSNARIGLLVRNSPGVRIMSNRITGVSVFGISVRGASPGVVGNDNTIAGKGFQPIDTRGGASPPLLTRSDVGAWQHRSSLTLVGYLRYHPILTTWFVILVLAALATLLARSRRPAPRPYAFTAAWTTAGLNGNGSNGHKAPLTVVAAPVSGRRARPARTVSRVRESAGSAPAAGVAGSADP